LKMYAECIPCQVKVRFRDISMLFSDENVRLKYMKIIIDELNNCLKHDMDNTVIIATRLFRLVKKLAGNDDPYRNEKMKANRLGMKLYEELKGKLKLLSGTERYMFSVKAALIGNSLDLGVASYTPPPIHKIAEEMKMVKVHYEGHLRLLEILKSKPTILYLLDNSGEAALDKLYSEELRRRGAYVIAVVKKGAFQNDVTTSEVEELKLDESFDSIVDTGTDGASIILEEVSPKFRNLLEEVDVIISKGMAHYEYLTEIEKLLNKPVLYMFKAKCTPIASSLKVSTGSYVALFKLINSRMGLR